MLDAVVQLVSEMFRRCAEALAGMPLESGFAPARFELTTPGLGNQCSIRLSYEAT